MLLALPFAPGEELIPASGPQRALSRAESTKYSSTINASPIAALPAPENASNCQYPAGSALRLLVRTRAKKTLESVAKVNGSLRAAGALGGMRL